ncbi:DUF2752 domain-containing protein [Nocardioides marinus]|uniref:DUF2752 domain-containing protein n=1 Tax=Nocardioides marinus TaxID=374514 RepID=A0A7Y9YE57_9ACTN|nr:DUF2752 domain-containing protein [Nocardioides marinus]NYI10546.1 hypothetical protein [Nocardioides marinus]
MSALLAPAPAPSRWDRVRAPLLTIGGLGIATLALHLRDPHVDGSWGLCPSAAMGFWCPGCGGLRAVNDLTHGEVVSAASSNLLVVVLMPFAVLALAVWASDRWRGRSRRLPRRVVVVGGYALLAAAGVFGLLRNTPAAPWLAP